MKRRIILILFAALLLTACAAKTDPVPAEAPKIIAPAETELSLRLPLGLRDDIARSIPAFAAGFSAAEGVGPLRFAVESADASVAEGMLEDDGTLLVIAHGAGETKLTVTAAAGSEHAAATVSVKVRDARRTLILCIAGALTVVLLILLGKPVKKAPVEAKEENPTVIIEPEEATPTVLFAPDDEPNDHPERS
jgi:hypothetical protein